MGIIIRSPVDVWLIGIVLGEWGNACTVKFPLHPLLQVYNMLMFSSDVEEPSSDSNLDLVIPDILKDLGTQV